MSRHRSPLAKRLTCRGEARHNSDIPVPAPHASSQPKARRRQKPTDVRRPLWPDISSPRVELAGCTCSKVTQLGERDLQRQSVWNFSGLSGPITSAGGRTPPLLPTPWLDDIGAKSLLFFSSSRPHQDPSPRDLRPRPAAAASHNGLRI